MALRLSSSEARRCTEENKTLVRSLVRLSQTCSMLREIAQPIGYHCPISENGFISLVRTLCERPDLASKVQVFRAGGGCIPALGAELSDAASNLFQSQMAQFTENRPQLFNEHPQLAVSALSLAKVPNAKSLTMVLSEEGADDFPFIANNGLPNVEEIYIENGQDALEHPCQDATEPILSAASSALKHFEMNGFFIEFLPMSTVESQITSLHLIDCRIEYDTMANLLYGWDRLSNLSEFIYRPGGAEIVDIVDASSSDASGAALRARRLRRLILDWRNAEDIYPKHDFLETDCCIESVRTLEFLEYLEISSRSICLHPHEVDEMHSDRDMLIARLLPPSIKALKILELDPRLVPALKYLARCAALHFTHLTDVYFESRGAECNEAVQAAFAGTSISTHFDV
ncbi:unnamed protein product [Clonostachys solani]|uniref:Uncharacterized protein n=1 Tax=Clonostachys solani TaxID=160281 RepID=A0A9P0EG12_9HYPO|nr:unnamed protein product [Clonostachys solani]